MNLFGSIQFWSILFGSFTFVHLLIGSICKKWVFHVSLVFGASFGEFLKHRTLIQFYLKVPISYPTQDDSIECQRIISILLLISYQHCWVESQQERVWVREEWTQLYVHCVRQWKNHVSIYFRVQICSACLVIVPQMDWYPVCLTQWSKDPLWEFPFGEGK